MLLSPRQIKKVKKAWQRAWINIPHPSFFAMVSLFLIGFARLDGSSSIPSPLSTEVIGASQVVSVQQIQEPSEVPNVAWGFFHPTWEKRSSWKISGVADSSSDPVVDPSWDAKTLVEDPESRVEKEFKVPTALKDRVAFWINIYSRYTSQIRVVHDRHNMSIVYGYLDFRPIFRTAATPAIAVARANEIEKKVLRDLKGRLLEAANGSKTKTLDSSEREAWREVLSRAGSLSVKDATALMQTVRTQSGQSDLFLVALHRSKNLLPHIESVFRQNALPAGLARIPFVESSFNADALSKTGAMGIWQFMPETAKEMIRSNDEKNWSDPLYQTRSAARLFRMYKNVLPDWGTAITSYNSGVGRVRRIVERYGYTKGEELVNSPQSEGLGFAGKNFFSEFLAANIVEAYKDEVFTHFVNPLDFALVFKGRAVFPSEACDL